LIQGKKRVPYFPVGIKKIRIGEKRKGSVENNTPQEIDNLDN
jgi:hypothetical protein